MSDDFDPDNPFVMGDEHGLSSSVSVESEMSEAGRCAAVTLLGSYRCSHENGHPGGDKHCSHDTVEGCMAFKADAAPTKEDACVLWDDEVAAVGARA